MHTTGFINTFSHFSNSSNRNYENISLRCPAVGLPNIIAVFDSMWNTAEENKLGDFALAFPRGIMGFTQNKQSN